MGITDETSTLLFAISSVHELIHDTDVTIELDSASLECVRFEPYWQGGWIDSSCYSSNELHI